MNFLGRGYLPNILPVKLGLELQLEKDVGVLPQYAEQQGRDAVSF